MTGCGAGGALTIPSVQERIVSLVPAERGWRALYTGEYPEDDESSRVIAWALTEDESGGQEVVGLVVDPNNPSRIVPAEEGVTPVAVSFDRYGFRGD
jgi:hypothetical protein